MGPDRVYKATGADPGGSHGHLRYDCRTCAPRSASAGGRTELPIATAALERALSSSTWAAAASPGEALRLGVRPVRGPRVQAPADELKVLTERADAGDGSGAPQDDEAVPSHDAPGPRPRRMPGRSACSRRATEIVGISVIAPRECSKNAASHLDDRARIDSRPQWQSPGENAHRVWRTPAGLPRTRTSPTPAPP